MNIVKRIFAVLLFLLALFTAAVAYHLIVHAQDAKLKVDDAAPTARLEAFFDALEARDYPAAYACLSNYGSLGLENAPDDPIAALLWEAEQDNWDFEILPDHEMNGAELMKRVRITALDTAALTAPIGEKVQEKLAAVVENATTNEEVYDEDGNYRTELLETALREAAEEAFADAAAHTVTREITVRLSYADGEWLIAADNQLLSALTSGAVR
ncbi:MAG: hypothetical protein IJR65_01685 [Oscillospiraceae bacterium]|nr:hypothetical protein [Oscillospiraceae bacterium]